MLRRKVTIKGLWITLVLIHKAKVIRCRFQLKADNTCVKINPFKADFITRVKKQALFDKMFPFRVQQVLLSIKGTETVPLGGNHGFISTQIQKHQSMRLSVYIISIKEAVTPYSTIGFKQFVPHFPLSFKDQKSTGRRQRCGGCVEVLLSPGLVRQVFS